ncbi:MAG: hypothetical protein H7839_17960 [Magnetococcus sp. YQC-5]
MSRKQIVGIVAVMLVAYLVGLVIYLPPDRMDQWLKKITQGRMSWQSVSLGWEGLRFVKLHGTPPFFSPDKEIEEVILRPQILPVLLGRIGVSYQMRLDFIRLGGDVTVNWNGANSRLAMEAQMDDLTKLAALWLGPMGGEVKGKGDGKGWMIATTTKPMGLDGGEWEIQGKGVTAFGARIEPLILNGVVKEKNVMEIRISGKGEIAVAGKLILKIILPEIRTSSISGEVQIQPIKANLPGMAGQFLGKGQPVRMTVSGSLDTMQWRIQ